MRGLKLPLIELKAILCKNYGNRERKRVLQRKKELEQRAIKSFMLP